jgi:hypothetical protein
MRVIQDHMKVPQRGKLHCRGGLNCLSLLMRRGIDWIGNGKESSSMVARITGAGAGW